MMSMHDAQAQITSPLAGSSIEQTPSAGLPRILWAGLIVGSVTLAILALWAIPGRPPKAAQGSPLSILGQVPEFSLVERSGRTVGRSDLLGTVWLADFIFTRCSGPCPELSLRMRSVQQSLKNQGRDVRLVSFSLDPTYDTPAVLSAYARRYHADPNRWWFLTGSDEAQMHRFVKDGLHQAVARAPGDGTMIHSTYFMLVDQSGRMRAVYDGLDGGSKRKILRDIDRLLGNPVGS